MTKKQAIQIELNDPQTSNRFRTYYDEPVIDGIEFTELSLTQQQWKEDTDINNIIRNMGNGLMPPMTEYPARYGDFSEPLEYQDAMNIVITANKTFEALPAEVRHRFGNNPQSFLEFATNPENVEDMVKWGLATVQDAEKVKEVLVERVRDEAPETAPVAENTTRKAQRRT